jgi:hypothetical protein
MSCLEHLYGGGYSMLCLQMMNNQPLGLKSQKHCYLKNLNVSISLQVALHQLPLQSNLTTVCHGLVHTPTLPPWNFRLLFKCPIFNYISSKIKFTEEQVTKTRKGVGE